MIKYNIPMPLKDSIQSIACDLNFFEEDIFCIYPDFINKRENTIASGLCIHSTENIYPTAMPDIGDALHVVKIQGLRRNVFNNDVITGLKDIITNTYQLQSIKIFKEALINGRYFKNNPLLKRKSSLYEDNGYYAIDKNHHFAEEIFFTKDNIYDISKMQGNFIEFLESNIDDEIFLLIHSGVESISNLFMAYYYPLLAELSYKNGWSSKTQIINGKFVIKHNTDIVSKYYNDFKGIMNLGFAYRDLLEYNIIDFLKNNIENDFTYELCSDFLHTKLSFDDGKIIHQRGIQKSISSDDLMYILCGNHGIASMLYSVKRDVYVSHGVQVQPALYSPIINTDLHKLFKYDIPKNNDTIIRAHLANICFNYFLEKEDIEFEKYIYPFFTYKEEYNAKKAF